MVERKKTLELKKHVATIHSSGKLSLLQRKIANALLFNAYEELQKKDEHEIHIGTLCKLIGYDSNDHKTIKKGLVNLLATVIEWNLVDGNRLDMEGIWNASSIIADASIDGAICTYSYSNKMKQLLHRPELYGRLNMLVQAKFQSNYGLALYENCIRFQNIEQTPWLEIAKFRKLMGVEDSKYKIFRDFKSRVLDKAVEEVNKYSPITITPQFRKQGRQVVAIQFTIKPSKDLLLEQQKTNTNIHDILKEKFGLSKKQADEVMLTYEENYIFEKMSIVESSASYIQGKIANLAKYLLSALKEDYQATKSSAQTIPVKRENRDEKQKRNERSKMEEYYRYQNKQMLKIFNKKSKNVQNKIISEFEKQLGKGIYRDIYLRDGLNNVLIQDQLCLFFRQKRPELVDEVPTFDEFCGAEA